MTTQSLAFKKGRVKPRLSGFKSLLTHQTLRRLVQLGFAAFITYVTIIHVASGESTLNVTASPEAYCPFGGLETLYKYITGGGSFVTHTHLSNLVMAIAVLVTALLLRSAFCGWICPAWFYSGYAPQFQRLAAEALRTGSQILPFPGARRAAGVGLSR